MVFRLLGGPVAEAEEKDTDRRRRRLTITVCSVGSPEPISMP